MAKGKRFVNPTDKARKEARKKELKKNKKQRQLVRSAVIEKKDPTQIISDLEKLDQLEYDALLGSAISDSLYKDKRKKLKETWERVLKHYSKEDPDKHQELKKLESDYEASHNKKIRQYEAIRAAQEVKLEDIPLPPDSHGEQSDDDETILLPDCVTFSSADRPPGCPPGVPPRLKDIVSKIKSTQALVVPSLQVASHVTARTMPIMGMLTIAPQRKAAFLPASLLPTPHNIDRNRVEKSSPVASSPRLSNVTHIKLKSALLPTPTDIISPPKAAIIESKPVIFRPKVTKFVPSAVRKKKGTASNPENMKTQQE